jgi:hypothetical protein
MLSAKAAIGEGRHGEGRLRPLAILVLPLGIVLALLATSQHRHRPHGDCDTLLSPFEAATTQAANYAGFHWSEAPGLSGFATMDSSGRSDVTSPASRPTVIKVASPDPQSMGYVLVDVTADNSRFVGCVIGPGPAAPRSQGLYSTSAPLTGMFGVRSTLLALPVTMRGKPYFSRFQVPGIPVAQGTPMTNGSPSAGIPIYPVVSGNYAQLDDVRDCRSKGCRVIRLLAIDISEVTANASIVRDVTLGPSATSQTRFVLPRQTRETVRVVVALAGTDDAGPFIAEENVHVE